MLAYRDYYGGDIYLRDEIKNAATKQDLAQIIEQYRSHIEDMANDASRHLDGLKKRVGLTIENIDKKD